jgi:hypothetical protein
VTATGQENNGGVMSLNISVPVSKIAAEARNRLRSWPAFALAPWWEINLCVWWRLILVYGADPYIAARRIWGWENYQ